MENGKVGGWFELWEEEHDMVPVVWPGWWAGGLFIMSTRLMINEDATRPFLFWFWVSGFWYSLCASLAEGLRNGVRLRRFEC